MNKSTKNSDKKSIITEQKESTNLQQSIFDIPESIIPEDKRLYFFDWDNKPPEPKTIVKTQNKRVLTTGNLLAIVSRPGTGKSAICEAILSSLINPECDSLGFQVDLPGFRCKVLYIDTERTTYDTYNAGARMYKRAGMKAPDKDQRILFANFKAISVSDRKAAVVKIFNENPDIGLVVFDGAGDFLIDTNSQHESVQFIDWINTFNPGISVIVTIHTNPTDNKPRGHIGSELCRRAEGVFLIRKLDDDVREITTQFDHGKVRNDSDKISMHYKFDNDMNMFVSCDYDKPAIRNNEKDLNKQKSNSELTRKIFAFAGEQELSYTYIVEQIMTICKKEKAASEKFVTRNLVPVLQKTVTGYMLPDDALVIPFERTNERTN